jgi:SNF2 family DNA or RNA helicase
MTGGWVHDEQGTSVEVQLAKLEVASDLLKDLAEADKSVVVFARFLAEMDALYEAAFRSYKANRYQIRGGVDHPRRRAIVKAFQSRAKGPSIVLVQVGAAEALDGLQTNCSHGIFYSSDFSLIHWSQARGRLDRVGQTDPVTFYHLHTKATVDSLIFQALQDKKDLERLVMDRPEILISR